MRTARLVGLSPDGTSLVLADDQDDELVLAADDRLRAALRAPAPRHRPTETSMDTELSPRDIQTRIRAGEAVEDLVEASGLPYERVERFAAPVLAEREHIALTALSCPVRRRGETAGHRLLRATVAERLLKRGVDVDGIDWDAHRLEDGRWSVTADYRLGEADQHASFAFDLRGRFSVAADDSGRWLIGEEPPGGTGGPRRRGTGEEEPTVDLSDELALVRAVQEAAAPAPEPAQAEGTPGAGVEPNAPEMSPAELERLNALLDDDTDLPPFRTLRAVPSGTPAPTPAEPRDPEPEPEPELEEPAEPAAGGSGAEAPGVEDASELTALYAMLGSDGYSEDSPRVYAGLSDASAVPETSGGGWEPAVVVDVPVEPSPAEEAELPAAEHPDRTAVPMDDKASVELSTPVDDGPPAGPLPGTDEPAPPYARTDEADRAEEAGEFQLESEPPAPKPAKRKRASVPSWDEIMFGGPKPPG